MIDKALLIDDDNATNVYHEIIMKESGKISSIDIQTNVDDSIEYLLTTESAPDIIFLDINMPLKNGWDFLDEYESIPSNRRAKVLIVLTTSKNISDEQKALTYKTVDQYCTKPLSKGHIAQLVVRFDRLSF